MIKGSIQEEDIKIINIYAPNIGAPQYLRQILTSMKEEINSNTIIVGDFNTPLTTMDREAKQKINKETQTLFFSFLFYFFKWFLSYIDMNQPWIYMYSPLRSPFPPRSPPDPSGSSQCTRSEHLAHASDLGW